MQTLVVGLGNDAMGDDGVGLYAVRRLAALPLPATVQLLEGGTLGYGLLSYLEGVTRLVLIDCTDMSLRPGAVRTLPLACWRRRRAVRSPLAHSISILDVLDLATALGLTPPESYVVGVQPAQVVLGFGLSEPVRRALSRAVASARRAATRGACRRAAHPKRRRQPWTSASGS
ncbi:MAG: hydrogenase maturation protease [Anaerolineae bacterium]